MDPLALVPGAVVVLLVAFAVRGALRRAAQAREAPPPTAIGETPPRLDGGGASAPMGALPPRRAGPVTSTATAPAAQPPAAPTKPAPAPRRGPDRQEDGGAPSPATSKAPVARPALDTAALTALVREGHLVAAIQQYRAATGVGLAEAKAAVEALREAPPAEAPAPRPVPAGLERVAALVSEGQLLQAIKTYRELTGANLVEAKHAIDSLRASAPPAAQPPKPDLLAPVYVELSAGRTIQAIKLYREATGLGLKQAKENVEALRDGRPLPHRA